MADSGARKKQKVVDGRMPEAIAADAESKRLHDKAFKTGVLARAKATAEGSLCPSKAIAKCSGRDIVKKGHRKNKYLFSFPGLVALVSAGAFGELAQLDTKNPVLYINFPQGRLKLFGTIIYPKNKYLTLHFSKGASSIACEDCFESLVVFSEAWWIGTKEANPEEKRLQIPKELEEVKKHNDFSFTGGMGRLPEGATVNPSKASLKQDQPDEGPSTQGAELSDPEGSLPDVGDGASQPTRRLPGRASAKKVSYAEKGESEGLDDDEEESSEEEGTPEEKLQPSRSAGGKASRQHVKSRLGDEPSSQPARKRRRGLTKEESADTGSQFDQLAEAEEQPTSQAKPQGKARQTSSRKAQAERKVAGRKRKQVETSDDEEPDPPSESEGNEDDNEDEDWRT